MLKVIVVSAVLLLVAVLLLGVRVFFVKGGQFPNIHIGGSKAMKERGIGCATSQDREAHRGRAKAEQCRHREANNGK